MNIKKIVFSLLAAVLPVAFLALVELSLWIVDAYPQPPLFLQISEDDTSYTQINSTVGERYFNKALMPVPNLFPQKFSSEKPAGTIRIFCLGGSTTAGFPYEMTAPFPKQLDLLLKADYPDLDFEVINMGLSAINSFTVVDWIPEILKQDPDLILLYMGHNEFYGAYGTGSTISLGHDGRIVRLVLKLQKLRFVQMIRSMIQGINEPPAQEADATLMEKVIAEKFIETNSTLRIKTRDNFSANLAVILSSCRSAGVPVIMSNLVSNIKDQMPLDVTSSNEQTSTKAQELYLKGLREFRQGDTTTAHISFTRAKNTDQVPFRGNDYLNEILQLNAGRFSQPIVDMKSAFRRASSSSIPGNDLFCDHLHPNPIGYHVMAREFRKAMDKTDILPQTTSQDTTMQPLLVTDLDWEIGGLQIFKLKQRWPFGNSTVDYSKYAPLYNDVTVRIAREYLFDHSVWGKAHSDMADYYLEQGDTNKACQEYQAIVEVYPGKTEYYTKLVECAKQLRQWELVKQTSQKALATTTSTGMFYYNLAISYRMTGDLEKAMSHIQIALDAPELMRIQLANVRFTFARFLLEDQKPSEAASVLTELLGESPDFSNAQELLDRLLN
jgi:tetratricopeptide (TPR) repeat protein